jgi:hypothetical protein
MSLYPSPCHPHEVKSQLATVRELVASRKEMFARPSATPEPAPPQELAENLFHPTETQIASACSCNGNDPSKAVQSYVQSGRATLRRLKTMLPETAQTITAGLQQAESLRRTALSIMEITVEKLNALKGALLERADLRNRIAAARTEFENAKATLASRNSLELDGGTLALLAQKERHLPGEIETLTAGLPAMTERIEHLAHELEVEPSAIVQRLYDEANVFCGGSWADTNFKRLHEARILWP